MLLPRLQPPLRAVIASIGRASSLPNSQACLNDAFAQLSICHVAIGFGSVRRASHKAQGAVNKAKDGPGKRLGAKRTGEQYVIPGNIIFRQRGTHWFPGENCAMGRDHTIYATECGYVKYYKDPDRHTKRQYIGVTFERDQVLPLPRNSMRRRRLGMVASKMELHTSASDVSDTQTQVQVQVGEVKGNSEGKEEVVVQIPMNRARKERKGEEGRVLRLRPGYMYREGNWEIGRAAERAKVKVREYKPRDRWTAWRKTVLRKTKVAERRGLSRKVPKNSTR